MGVRPTTHAAQLTAHVPTVSLPVTEEEAVDAAAEAAAAEDEAAILIVKHYHLGLANLLGLLLDRPRIKSHYMTQSRDSQGG